MAVLQRCFKYSHNRLLTISIPSKSNSNGNPADGNTTIVEIAES